MDNAARNAVERKAEPRTFTGRGGRQVVSIYTDIEAVERLRVMVREGLLKGEFPASLAQRDYHSENQIAWVHILVVEAESNGGRAERDGPTVMPDLDPIRELFRTAQRAGLKSPRIRMEIEGVGRVVLAVGGPRSRHPGHYMVSDGAAFGVRRFYGRIEPQRAGEVDAFHATAACTTGVVEALVDLALDPAGVASAYGRRCGACCFCGLELTDGRSVAVGYGPICADNYGLPWGDVKVDTRVELFEQREGQPSASRSEIERRRAAAGWCTEDEDAVSELMASHGLSRADAEEEALRTLEADRAAEQDEQ